MQINSADYEKLGTFYLGREYDQDTKALQDKLVLYDSKDLVTHGVVLGMTGSGKTGLCFALLEEAAMDKIPALVIDPKGDITNFLLTFPDLAPQDFRPWINEEDAEKKGKTPDEFAAGQAEMWKKGLGDWGQSAERIRTLRETVDIVIFTPGSSAGIPVSILSSFKCPEFEVIDDAELFGDRIESTVSSILSLCQIDADPISSKDHILLSSIFNHAWRAGEDLGLERIIEYVQAPPMAKIGVIGVDDFYPEKKRSEFAMKINNLLAAPGFQAWLNGEPLDIKRMLHTESGKPRISIFCIAHLNDAERMFFVSLVLNQTVGWMRSQSGTTSLRALVYMDEIYGYLPPTANPPSKKPMMILLKQARAFGVGCLLATQNPVDLDYKALSNIGTWFLGRLQTERDKNRVLDGLEGAASSQNAKFNRADMDRMLAGLGNRVFLMNNTHEDHPVVFQVRWVMTYLRGPLTRSQIKLLMDPRRSEFKLEGPATVKKSAAAKPKAKKKAAEEQEAEEPEEAEVEEAEADADEENATPTKAGADRPVVPASVVQYFLPVTSPAASPLPVVYQPAVFCAAEVLFTDNAKGISERRKLAAMHRIDGDTVALTAEGSERVDLDPKSLSQQPVAGASFGALPAIARKTPSYTTVKTQFVEWIYQNFTLDLLRCDALDELSKPGESEGDFKARLQHKAREERDRALDAIRVKYQPKFLDLEQDRRKALEIIDRERSQARAAKVSTGIGILQGVLGAVFGSRKVSSAISKGSTAMRGASKAWKEGGDVGRAEDRLAEVEQALADLNGELELKMEEIRAGFDIDRQPLAKVAISPMKKNIAVQASGLAWIPMYDVGGGSLEAAWEA